MGRSDGDDEVCFLMGKMRLRACRLAVLKTGGGERVSFAVLDFRERSVRARMIRRSVRAGPS